MYDLKKEFGSDNYSSVSPEILEFIQTINFGHCHGYGDDPITNEAITIIKSEFGNKAECFFTLNGTGTNITAINALTRPYEAIVCAETAHINTDECGALEKVTGNKILPIKPSNGKITPEQITPFLAQIGDEHSVQPKVISITQPTEVGTIYSKEEIQSLATLAHQNNMILHMDGARLSNAVAKMDISFKEATYDLGVDIISFGGTKNGMMIGEVIISFLDQANKAIPFLRKQNNQLLSKMRYLSGQFIPYFQQNIWKINAEKANFTATYFYNQVKNIPYIQVLYPVDTNALFVRIPKEMIKPLQKVNFFYARDPRDTVVRWMTTFDTTTAEIDNFVSELKIIAQSLSIQ
ncbi:aminotransferase class V-fold PLP-dependent enzyme [Halosquirtibacter xylanolyticus]|uniref:threonine aldolase family protein n=1 Tax=Halosquirtibacter xylanolyticus TaxID=3374599 RepID=UPI00374894F9|nr:aminotransferase class V-fold PLP-dependent enzyme [Prolixibacteraceae bacterium]